MNNDDYLDKKVSQLEEYLNHKKNDTLYEFFNNLISFKDELIPELLEDYINLHKLIDINIKKTISEENKDNLDKLVYILNICSDAYYNKSFSLISDKRFDDLLKFLENAERLGYKNEYSPVGKVGYKPINTDKLIIHKTKLMSLQNSYNENDVIKFINSIIKLNKPFTLIREPKLDGMAIALTYQKGKLISMATRGDGIEGQNITSKVPYISNIPLVLWKFDLFTDSIITITGEMVISLEDFDKINLEREINNLKPFSNPRNFTAGQIMSDDPEYLKYLRFFAYGVDDDSMNILIQKNTLKVNGFDVTKYELVQDLININKSLIPFNLPYATDGLVFKVVEKDLQKELGSTSKFPKWSIAYKFDPEAVISILRDVKWFVGKTGKLTPVGYIDPVEVSGSVVSKLNLYNQPEIERLGVTIGSKVYVVKAAEIIPRIKTVIESTENKISIPRFCPDCNSELTLLGPELYCENEKCPAKIKAKLIFFAGKSGMDIKNLGEKIIIKLYNDGLLNDLDDFYNLKNHIDKLKDIIGPNHYINILNEIEESKKNSFSKVLTSLSIPEMGSVSCKELCENFPDVSFNKLINDANLGMQKFFNIYNSKGDSKRLGNITTLNLFKFFTSQDNIKMILKLADHGIVAYNDISKETIKPNNIRVAITGSFAMSRSKIIEILEKKGYIIVTSVTKNTDLLLSGSDSGSKLEKAQKLGIKIILEPEVYNFLET